MKIGPETLCKALKIITAASCVLGFILNSLAIFNNFARKATTVTNEEEALNARGLKTPTITICALVPFANISMDNVTYESYDANTMSQEDVIEMTGSLKSGKLLKKGVKVDIATMYTMENGRCYVVNFKKNVCI